MSLIHELQEKFGRPVTLRRVLADHSAVQTVLKDSTGGIGVRSVVRWDEWGAARDSMRVSRGGEGNSARSVQPPKLPLGVCRMTEEWECEIQDVAGFASSKSDLAQFPSLDEMVESNSPEMIEEITERKLEEHLAHREIRILHQPRSSDYFARFAWDGRLFLMNEGGSHHFAAARYISARIGRPVSLRATLRCYELELSAIVSLRRDFDLYALSGEQADLYRFHEAFRAHRATYFWLPLPVPYERGCAIFLPKNLSRSARLSRELAGAGVFDLGLHLSALAQPASEHR